MTKKNLVIIFTLAIIASVIGGGYALLSNGGKSPVSIQSMINSPYEKEPGSLGSDAKQIIVIPDDSEAVYIGAHMVFKVIGSSSESLEVEDVRGLFATPWQYPIKSIDDNTITVDAMYMAPGSKGAVASTFSKPFIEIKLLSGESGTISLDEENSYLVTSDNNKVSLKLKFAAK